MRTFREQLRGLTQLAVTDAFAPAESVLFVANELAVTNRFNTQGNQQRASHRMLYGTTVAYRPQGHEEDHFGFTYNISAGGLYVRTLAPPTQDDLWLELRPPRTNRRVRLEARVAWRKGLDPIEHATVPAGFGVAITDGTQSDRDTWQQGCHRFEEDLR